MEIRKATLADLDAISEMELRCFPEAEAATRKSFEERIRVFGDYFWLLEKDGEIISMINGMVSDEPMLKDEMFEDANMHNENGAWQMIFGVDTLPQYQKKGYAAQVMERVIADCKKQGRKGIVLTCKDRLVHYYEKFGYVNEGKSESVHGGAVWYDMRLTF